MIKKNGLGADRGLFLAQPAWDQTSPAPAEERRAGSDQD
jgi:hypothetical protein